MENNDRETDIDSSLANMALLLLLLLLLLCFYVELNA